jgi:hypothetical protein
MHQCCIYANSCLCCIPLFNDQVIRKKNNKAYFPTCVKTWSGILLLIFYLLASHVQDIHRSLHKEHQQSVLHSPQQEEDPCHRNLFHHEENTCEHKTHISNAERCSLCEWVIEKEEWIASNDPVVTIRVIAVMNSVPLNLQETDLSIHLCSRAPPVS